MIRTELVSSTAIVIIVRPLNALSAACRRAVSVSLSNELVASSRIKQTDPRNIARARQNSCRWPALKFEPPSTISVSAKSQTNREIINGAQQGYKGKTIKFPQFYQKQKTKVKLSTSQLNSIESHTNIFRIMDTSLSPFTHLVRVAVYSRHP